jgi:hypothetical protein
VKTLHDPGARAEILDRLGRLTPAATPGWGRMDAVHMVAHLVDALRMGTGELPLPFKKSPLRLRPVKLLVIYALPFPRDVPTAPGLIARPPGDWQREVDEMRTRVQSFTANPDVVHPIFGKLSLKDWGALAYKHVDHHFRQFGV